MKKYLILLTGMFLISLVSAIDIAVTTDTNVHYINSTSTLKVGDNHAFPNSSRDVSIAEENGNVAISYTYIDPFNRSAIGFNSNLINWNHEKVASISSTATVNKTYFKSKTYIVNQTPYLFFSLIEIDNANFETNYTLIGCKRGSSWNCFILQNISDPFPNQYLNGFDVRYDITNNQFHSTYSYRDKTSVFPDYINIILLNQKLAIVSNRSYQNNQPFNEISHLSYSLPSSIVFSTIPKQIFWRLSSKSIVGLDTYDQANGKVEVMEIGGNPLAIYFKRNLTKTNKIYVADPMNSTLISPLRIFDFGNQIEIIDFSSDTKDSVAFVAANTSNLTDTYPVHAKFTGAGNCGVNNWFSCTILPKINKIKEVALARVE